MSLDILLDDDVTPADITLARVAGADTDVQTFHVRNSYAQEVRNVALVDTTQPQDEPEVFVRSGAPPQDQQWGLARIVGCDNAADPTWSVASTAWTYLGAYRALLIGRIPAGCAVYVEYKEHPPQSAAALNWRRQLIPIYDVYSIPAPEGLTRGMRGVLTGVGDFSRTGLIRGGAVTTTGTPDDQIHVEASLYLWVG